MKKHLYFLLLGFLFSTGYMFGCKKTESHSGQSTGINLDSTLVFYLQHYLAEQKDKMSKNGKTTIDSIISNSRWDVAEQLMISNTLSIIYVPVGEQTLGITYFYNRQKQSVDSCYLVDISTTMSNYFFKKMDVIQSRYRPNKTKLNATFTGLFRDFSIDNKFKSEIKYDKGSVVYTKDLRTKGLTQKGNIRTFETCIAWYWVTTYPNGSENWQYMYTQCDNCDEQPYSVAITTAKMYIRKADCLGGGGGVLPTPQNECNYTSEEAKDLLNTMSVISGTGSIINMPNGAQTTDTITGIIREPRLIFLDALTVNYIVSNATQYYEAMFGGIRYRNNAADQIYKWEELNYVGLSSRYGTTPPCVEVELSSACSPIVISESKTSASVVMYAAVDIKLNCLPSGSWSQSKKHKINYFNISAN